MTSLGPELKRERELRNISLREIAEATKINLRFLEALEKDRFDLLPGKFFTRGIIRSYAKYLGLEEHAILTHYQETQQQQQQKKQEDEHVPAEKEEEASLRTKRIFSYAVMAIFLTTVLVVFFILLQKDGRDAGMVSEQPVPTFIEKRESPPVEAPETVMQGLQLTITFQQETWIQVYADGTLRQDGIKQPQESFETTAQESLLINTGNAGGFTFTLNGRKGKALGAPGEVAKQVRITLDNYREFFEQENREPSPPAEDLRGG